MAKSIGVAARAASLALLGVLAACGSESDPPPAQGSLVGTWRGATELGALTLFADGKFIYCEAAGVPPNGVEAGTYVYDPVRREIAFTVTYDTIIDPGVSDGGITDGGTSPYVLGAVLQPNGHLLFAGVVDMTRQAVGTGIAGTWRPADDAPLGELVLFDDGKFLYVEVGGEPTNGLEAGTYTYDDAADTLSFTLSFSDNLNGGIDDAPAADPLPPSGPWTLPAVLSGNALQFADVVALTRR